jgi:TonB family protein
MRAMLRALRILRPYGVVLIMLFCLPALAQSGGGGMKHFSAEPVSFDYPDGWTVKEESSETAQQFVITRKGSSAQITVLAQRDIVLRAKMSAARDRITRPLEEELARQLGAPAKAPERTPSRIAVGGVEEEGLRLVGTLDKRAGTAEIYSLRRGLRFVNLVYVRANKDEKQAAVAWKAVRDSLKIENPVIGVKKPPEGDASGGTDSSGGLNVLARELPRPEYPEIARRARASGTVTVQVTIDEQGQVIMARAVSGHPLLFAAAVTAARAAKFSPIKVDGEPVKVTGVITYNFLPR